MHTPKLQWGHHTSPYDKGVEFILKRKAKIVLSIPYTMLEVDDPSSVIVQECGSVKHVTID